MHRHFRDCDPPLTSFFDGVNPWGERCYRCGARWRDLRRRLWGRS